MRAPWAGLVVLGVALVATTSAAQADDEQVLRVVSIDTSQALAPSIVVAVPGLSAGQVLAPTAFSAVDDQGPRPMGVEQPGVGQLDVALVIDTAADVPLSTLGNQQATAVELLRHLQGAGELGTYTSTAQVLQPPTPDRLANFSSIAEVRPDGDRHFAAGLLSALSHFRPDTVSRRAIIVTSAGTADLTTPAETAVLAQDMTGRGVQLFWVVMDGTAPPIVQDLAASGQPVTVIAGKAAAAAADQVAAALQAQYRVTIDLTGAVGPVRLRVEVDGVVHEVALRRRRGGPRSANHVAAVDDACRSRATAPPHPCPRPPGRPRHRPRSPLDGAPDDRRRPDRDDAVGRIVGANARRDRRRDQRHVAGVGRLRVRRRRHDARSGGRQHVERRRPPTPPRGANGQRPERPSSPFDDRSTRPRQREKSDMDKLVVVGQGYVGLPLAVRAAEVGFRVVGFDLDEFRVKHLASGESFVAEVTDEQLDAVLQSGLYTVTDEPKKCAGFDYAVISVPTPLKDGAPDLSYIEGASRHLARFMRPGSTVVLESTTYPGTTEEIVGPLLEEGSGLTVGEDFYLGYSPERIDPGNTTWTLVNTPKIVSGIDADVAESRIDGFYRRLVEHTVPVARPAEAELAKLLENTFRHVNIALVNETAMFAHELGIDIWDALDAAATKPFGYMRFNPGPGVGGHCLPVDPSYLSWQRPRHAGRPFRFIELANDINTGMPNYVVNRLVLALNERSLSRQGPEHPAPRAVVQEEHRRPRESRRGSSPVGSLPWAPTSSAADPCLVEADVPAGVGLVDLTDAELARADAVVLLVDHDQFDFATISSNGRLRPRLSAGPQWPERRGPVNRRRCAPSTSRRRSDATRRTVATPRSA